MKTGQWCGPPCPRGRPRPAPRARRPAPLRRNFGQCAAPWLLFRRVPPSDRILTSQTSRTPVDPFPAPAGAAEVSPWRKPWDGAPWRDEPPARHPDLSILEILQWYGLADAVARVV